ncbi:GPI ethanolamine phosphate transferase 2 [Neocloeon triangulifer]|uniref:GPI ethanolamine phosphate transferase 2 n=1 Tax=Neocloeon triangulifer TaxID=2078957 RepID=UPI00286EC76C|nr:GPI ethanolamine phosphate transferase 2 [Neocloeon triangulifer]XP_059484711.1 GPI ethanolamine phosphate transferase 2 [Neocloeon triangulifer]XP_059484712.1 GPI ethanolamine phosphate transferase 2 [Neocloeon triangulifer]XP_059484713.1 GPI ethanolamine phosphate transferase 2 [Neocloeon triangulifer]XP_059484714.1 GPI ethanolamine phosphate transferase 2 [Neocloeon triangulifer]
MKPVNALAHIRTHFIALVGIALFLAGFMSVEQSFDRVPYNVSSSILRSPVALKQRRIVLMVVDALRDDFLDLKEDWKFVSNELVEQRACRLAVKVDSPTVTLPRLKALVTGRASSFIDVILNLGSPELQEDNLVSSLVNAGRHVVFYGDDTWLRILPHSFHRSRGTHSFFVNDFKEVDDNVTRELPSELAVKDWSLMILHYLGLDHIGHVEGPRSPLVGPKLREMDDVVRQIRESAPDALLVLTGDHGMADAGGHGGSSGPERSVALVLLGTPCLSISTKQTVWAQVDLAPTLATLLGVQSPSQSIGSLVPPLLSALEQEEILAALKNNTRHLVELNPGHEQEIMYLDAVSAHNKWIIGQGSFRKVAEGYNDVALLMRNALGSNHAPFDLYAMAIGAVTTLMSTSWIILASIVNKYESSSFWLIMVGASGILGIHSVACGFTFGHSLVCSSSLISHPLHILLGLELATITLEVVGMAKKLRSRDFPLRVFSIEWLLLAIAVGHTFSLGSSFCIEEEHLTWFVLWPVVLLVATVVRRHRWPFMLLLMAAHVALCHFNSTGDKWASTPDLEDWLVGKPMVTSVLLALSLAGLPFLMSGGRAVAYLLVTLIYLQKAASSDSVLAPINRQFSSDRGVMEARLFYLISTAWLFFRLRGRSKRAAFRDWWLLAAALLQRPHDVATLTYATVAARLVIPCFSNHVIAALAATTLGWTTFYHQGNSNQLTTVAVAAGYTGLTDYWPLAVGVQLIIRTYAGPVLAALELAVRVDGHRKALLAWSGQRLLAACFYLLVAAWLREHLFVWSVFAPKLLYEAVHSTLYIILLPVLWGTRK